MSRIAFLQDLFTQVFYRQPTGEPREDDRSMQALCEALLSERGEVSGNRLASSILGRFQAANDRDCLGYFHLLAERFDIDADAVLGAAEAYCGKRSAAHLTSLLKLAEPPRQELLRRLNREPGAIGALVEIRARLLEAMRQEPDLARIDLDFQHLFASWFNRGFLVLREIDWHTPANILERIIRYEAVHAIDSWNDLRERVEPGDRKCFAFFHPAMLDEPLIFVEVALVQEMPDSIGEILDPKRAELPADQATTAVFYSISNCQKGLRGVSFGNFLIKQVVNELCAELAGLDTFRTLSPVPGLMRWLRDQAGPSDVDPATRQQLLDLASHGVSGVELEAAADAHADADADADADAEVDNAKRAALVAHYLVNARRPDGQPVDAVARFHLGNGASLSKILPDADASLSGRQQSGGAMVSYLYALDAIEKNHERYAAEREVIVSDSVTALLAPPRKARKKAS